MLNWITSKLKQDKEASDHPLASEGAIRAFLAELTPGKPETTLLELIDWLADPAELSRRLAPEAVIRAVVRIDEFAQIKVSACWAGFLGEARVDHLAEQKLKTLDAYYQATYGAYAHALQLLAAKPAAAGSNLTSLTGLFCQRAMFALVGRLRILHIRYRAPDAAWWQAVAATLASAEAGSVLNLKQRTYPDSPVPSSTWLEVLIALFYEISPLGNLVPQQMDLLNRLLRWLEPHFMVQDNYSNQSPYSFRLDQPAMPKRTAEALPANAKLVYFGPGLAYGQLVRLRATIKSAGALPDWMSASLCPTEKAIALVDALIMHWSERPPARRFARAQKAAVLNVCNGFSQIRRMNAFSEFARSGRKLGYKSHLEMLKFERFGFADSTQSSAAEEEKWAKLSPLETVRLLETSGDRQMMDKWTMQDISEKGVGATAPFLIPWMVIGAYVGFRVDEEIDWRIGILRRIHRTASGHPAVGIEMLPELPRCAQIQAAKTGVGSNPWSQTGREKFGDSLQDAIVISLSESLMLIPTGLFRENLALDLVLAGSRSPVRLKALLHQNPDCDCVQYELVEASETANS